MILLSFVEIKKEGVAFLFHTLKYSIAIKFACLSYYVDDFCEICHKEKRMAHRFSYRRLSILRFPI